MKAPTAASTRANPNRDESSQAALPSDRSFGLLMATVSVLVSAYFFSKNLALWSSLCLLVGMVFLSLALVRPQWLRPLNQAWNHLGLTLGRVVNPIVLGAIFYLMISPVAIVTRLFGRDVLKVRKFRDPARRSYWVERTPPGVSASGFKNQF